MPKGTNKFYARDKLEIAQKISGQINLRKEFIGDYVDDIQKFVVDRNIMPSKEPKSNAVVFVAAGEGDKFARVRYDGSTEPIDQETYYSESIYNYLPARFKTYIPEG